VSRIATATPAGRSRDPRNPKHAVGGALDPGKHRGVCPGLASLGIDPAQTRVKTRFAGGNNVNADTELHNYRPSHSSLRDQPQTASSNGETTMRFKSKKRAGFTLVEIMVVTSLIGLLSTLAVPAALRARNHAAIETIRTNLRVIEDSKALWATESRSGIGAVPTSTDLEDYIKGHSLPHSVMGETYTLNAIGTPVTATLTFAVGPLPAGQVITLE